MGRPLLVVLSLIGLVSACGRETFPGDPPATDGATPTPGSSSVPTSTPSTIDHTDPGFGDLGRVHAAFNGNSRASRAARDANDNIVVDGSTDDDTALARYTGAGQLDATFASIGWERLDITGKSATDWSNSVALLPNGKLLVSGGATASNHNYAKLARFNADGTRDATFGSNGVIAMDFGFQDSDAISVVAAPDGSAFVGIDANTSSQHAWIIAKILPSGALDTGFGTSSRAAVGLDFLYQQAELSDICLTPGGGVLLAGTMHDDTMLVKLTSSGKIDTSFGGGSGYVNRGAGSQVSLWSVSSLKNGDLLVTGAAVSPVDGATLDVFAMETTAGGGVETAFAKNGTLISDFGGDTEWGTHAIEAGDGSLSIGVTSAGLGILRLAADGSPDLTWGALGLARSSVSTPSDYAEDLVQLSTGRFVVVGSNIDQPDTFVLAGFN